MENVKTNESRQLQKLRINLDLKWTTREFHLFFKSIENLYGLYFGYFEGLKILEERNSSSTSYAHEHHTPMFHFVVRNSMLRSFYNQEGIFETEEYPSHLKGGWRENLVVSTVQYSSPGFTDFVGLSGVIGHLKEILMHYIPNKVTKEEVRIKEQERIKLQIENLKQMGFTPIEIQKIILLEAMSLDKIKYLMQEGLITSIQLNEN